LALALGKLGKLTSFIPESLHIYTRFSVYDYKVLPFSGAQVIEEANNVASYSYDPSLKELISYDTPNIVKTKSQYIVSNGMAVSDLLLSLDGMLIQCSA